MIIDTHLHIGDRNNCKEILRTSKFKDLYRLYSCLDVDTINETDRFIDKIDNFFAIPIVFCETDIIGANQYVLDYSMKHEKAIPVLLIGDNCNFERIASMSKYNIFKEHFSLHSCDGVSERNMIYDYISSSNGYLLLHTFQEKTYDHVIYLRKMFPNMKIIIAHLGRDSFASWDYTKNMIDLLSKDKNMLTDISTIKNIDLIKYAIKMYGSNRVLFGTDFPYEVSSEIKLEKYLENIYSLNLRSNDIDNILFNNALNIIAESKIKVLRK